MNRLGIKLFVAVITFALGASCAYLVWIIYSQPSISPPDSSFSESPAARIASFPETVSQEIAIEEEWQNLLKAEGCLTDPVFYPLNYLPSVKRDERKAVAFLISRIPETRRTRIHVSPYGQALEGEIALYCLQDAFDIPWYKLKAEYELEVKRSMSADYPNDYQSLLQRKIKSPRGSKELMDLWERYYESRVSSKLGN